MTAQFAAKRLGKELQKVYTSPGQPLHPAPLSVTQELTPVPCQINGNLPPGITLVSAANFEEWSLDIKVLDQNPLYLDQTYRLKFKFSPQYPIGTRVLLHPPRPLHRLSREERERADWT